MFDLNWSSEMEMLPFYLVRNVTMQKKKMYIARVLDFLLYFIHAHIFLIFKWWEVIQSNQA
jgi:hypothetical protein